MQSLHLLKILKFVALLSRQIAHGSDISWYILYSPVSSCIYDLYGGSLQVISRQYYMLEPELVLGPYKNPPVPQLIVLQYERCILYSMLLCLDRHMVSAHKLKSARHNHQPTVGNHNSDSDEVEILENTATATSGHQGSQELGKQARINNRLPESEGTVLVPILLIIQRAIVNFVL
jgi:hypothetical protein